MRGCSMFLLSLIMLAGSLLATSHVITNTTDVATGTRLGGMIVGGSNAPQDVTVYALTDTIVTSTDSLAASGDRNVYGPYMLTKTGCGQARSIQLNFTSGFIGASDTVFVDYQTGQGLLLKDTAAVWTRADTVLGAGKVITADMTGKAAQVIWIRITSYKSTVVRLANRIKLGIKGNCQ